MFIKIFLFILISIKLFSASLEEIYYIESNDINLSCIIPDIKEDVNLFSIEQDRYTKRVKSEVLIKLLDEHGYSSYEASSRFIKFIKKSPIDTSKMESALEELYERSYPNIKINKISILPRGYIESLDNDYTVVIKAKNNLNKSGIIYVKTNDNKKIFFDYDVDAEVSIYFARTKIEKGVELSALNTIKKIVLLDKFRDMPIQGDELSGLQSKHAIKQDTIIGEKNTETVVLVKRGSSVNVKLNDESMAISFTAESLQNGKLGDIITVKKSDGKRLKATVIGKNRVEMR